MSKAVVDENFWHTFQMTEEDFRMRVAVSPHHTNPRSATLDFWRKTTPYNQYRIIQDRRRKQMNQPTSSSHTKEEHMIIAQALASMEKRRVGTRFLDREVTEEDHEKPLMVIIQEQTEKCSLM